MASSNQVNRFFKLQLSMKVVLLLPCLVAALVFFAKIAFRQGQDGWEGNFVGTEIGGVPFIHYGSLGSQDDTKAKFGYIVIDTHNTSTNLVPKERVDGEWGKTFAGRRIPFIKGAFYLAICKDGEVLFFDEVTDPWVRSKFAKDAYRAIEPQDIDKIAKSVGVAMDLSQHAVRSANASADVDLVDRLRNGTYAPKKPNHDGTKDSPDPP
jgi:hypothetical protein